MEARRKKSTAAARGAGMWPRCDRASDLAKNAIQAMEAENDALRFDMSHDLDASHIRAWAEVHRLVCIAIRRFFYE